MPKELVISAAPHETRVAILEDGQLCEIYIEREKEFALVGSIYKGRVTRVLPGMQSAFVDIGLDSDAFLYVGDFLENLEDYDHVVSPAENKIEKMEQQGGNTFVQPASVEGETQPAASETSQATSGFPAGESGVDEDAQPQSSASESGSGQSDEADFDGPQPGNIADPRSGQQTGQQQPRAGQSNQGTSRYAAPSQSLPGQPAPPRTPFGRQERGPGNFAGQNRGNDRGSDRGNDRGNDRGGRRRGGRWRRGGGRDNQGRPGGRDLPPSKYASTSPSAPRPFTPRPYEPPPPAEELPADFEPIILPGESLAKYKDRIPGSGQTSTSTSSQAPGAAHSAASSIPPAQAAEVKGPVSESGLPGLPTSLYASPTETPQVPRVSEHGTVVPPSVVPSAAPSSKEHSEFAPVHEQQPAQAAETHASLAGGAAELTDDEVTELAEQLAEARQEEASAEAEAKLGTGRRFDEDTPPPPESAAERDEFIAEVREQEEEDADKEHEIAHQAAQAGEDAHGQGFSSESDQEQEHDAQETEDDEAEDNDEPMPGNEAHSESGAELAADSGSESESDQALADHAQALADQIGNVAPQSRQDRPQTSARIGGQPNRARFQRPMRRGGRQRTGGGGGGHRPQRQHDSRHQQAQRRPQLISEMLKAGQEILVQIAKEPLGKKGARITSHVALPGRFLVYMPTVNHIGVSRRIGSADERSRLRRLVTEAKSTFPGGFIVRTAAEGAPDDEIRADVEFLGRTWEKTLSQAEPRKAPSLLHRDLNLVERILRDYVSNDYTAIWINSQEEYSKVVEFVSRFQPKLVDRVKLYTKSTPIFEEFGIQQELDKALRPKVWLKSGGYIVINHTEALVAIDVNTGKYVGRGSTRLEDTIVKTNLEAVKEIVRQIRLRDLGGIIILDFIDMEERRNRDKVMAALDSALRADRAPSKALSFNEFGLVAVTRKRTKQALERVLCQPCPYCTGSGMVKSVPTICYEIQAEARKMSPDLDASSLTLRVHPEIAKTLKTREAALIEELEQITRKSVIIQADPTLHWEQYDIY